MIVLEPTMADTSCVTLWLRPNRALSHRALRRVAWAVAAVTMVIALVGAQQGNVFAPVFALIESAAVAYALGVAWHAGDRSERIRLDARALEVEVLPGRRRTQFPSGWVRVLLRPGHGHHRLLLASHGREIEIGAFLAEGERAEVSEKLRMLLAQVTAPPHR